MSEERARRLRPVRRGDWKTRSMPAGHRQLAIDRLFSEEVCQRIRMGILSRQMEEKWFAYYEAPWLYLHRSWTGILVYRVRFRQQAEGCRAVELWVNQDSAQYRFADDPRTEVRRALEVIDALFVGSRPGAQPEGSEGLARWSQLGSAMLGSAPQVGFDLDLDGARGGPGGGSPGSRPLERFSGALLALACGDALGAPSEFLSREQVRERYDWLSGMVGGGRHGWAPGEWTDDTGMTLAVAEGILAAPDDPVDAIGERFLEWRRTAKDVGGTIGAALEAYRGDWARAARATPQARSGRGAGNGSLMRTLPVALAYPDRQRMLRQASRISAMTHWDPQAEMVCHIYCLWIRELLQGKPLRAALEMALAAARELEGAGPLAPGTPGPGPLPSHFWPALDRIPELEESAIQPTGYAGYSLHCLQAAAWLVLRRPSAVAVLEAAANLGGETDTIGAVAGGICGVRFGGGSLLPCWLELLRERERIERAGRDLGELRHRLVYDTPGLPRFSHYGAQPRIRAGRNPLTSRDVEELAQQGVTTLVDLREAVEWSAPGRYGAEAVAALEWCGIERVAVPCADGAALPGERIGQAVEALQGALYDSGSAYLCCRAGRERTGAVLVAYVAREQGLSYDDALARLRERGAPIDPLPAQRRAVERWLAR